jgi:hypothetical protein
LIGAIVAFVGYTVAGKIWNFIESEVMDGIDGSSFVKVMR